MYRIFLVEFVLLDLQFYVYILQIVVCPFVLFILAIVLSVHLRYTDSDYSFGIFKLFLHLAFIIVVKNCRHRFRYLPFHHQQYGIQHLWNITTFFWRDFSILFVSTNILIPLTHIKTIFGHFSYQENKHIKQQFYNRTLYT